MKGGHVSIEPDERGFFHVNYWEEEPPLEYCPCDGFATTKKGASLDDAVALAKKFEPKSICVWETCPECGGSGVCGDIEIEWEDCCECEDGMICRQLENV